MHRDFVRILLFSLIFHTIIVGLEVKRREKLPFNAQPYSGVHFIMSLSMENVMESHSGYMLSI
jgi:hypothetical protein